MNNNRNNRRRGRGNRNQAGNGNQVNRIDSRARGNAPQLLDKYKKLAQDAQHNGDRVQMEYYLQFADHYFRVIADNKARQEEARGRRYEEREAQADESEDDFDGDRPRGSERGARPRADDEPVVVGDEGEFAVEGEFASEGEAFLGDPAEDAAAAADAAAERASARRSRQRKPREESGEKRSERGDKPRRKPRRTESSDDGPAGIDQSILPPSIRADEAGDSDGNLEAVG
ncbi:MAG: DUF4167 domain-containing protein [Erythrobacter sp.]